MHRPAFVSDGVNATYHNARGMALWREMLEVQAKGYQALRVSLEEHTGPFWPLDGPPLPPVSVELTPQ
jgi:hypothetical protein